MPQEYLKMTSLARGDPQIRPKNMINSSLNLLNDSIIYSENVSRLI